MTDAEVFVFMEVFQGLRRVFPLRGEEHEIRQVGASYFKALRRYPLSAVQAGADQCTANLKRFPKPAEWIDAIPRRTAPTTEIDVMSEAEAAEYRRAEGLKYEDRPCACQFCVTAGMTERPLRFVPEEAAQGGDRKMRDPKSDRLVTAGHWAHGHELARYYEARANFWNAMIATFPGLVNPSGRDVGRQIAVLLNPRDRMTKLGT